MHGGQSGPRQAGSRLRRAWTIFRAEGWLVLWFRVLGETLYRRVLLLELALPAAGTAPPDVAARWLKPEEALAYAAFHPALTADEVRRRLAIGGRCLVLEAGGRMVHGKWAAFEQAWIEYLDLAVPLASGTAYTYQSYTPPDLRGHGYATAGVLASAHILFREGFNVTLTCLQPDRAIAYPPILRAGYRPVGYLGWFRVGPWRVPLRRRTARFPWYAPRPWARQTGRTTEDSTASVAPA